MNRYEAEKAIYERMCEIRDIVKEVNPEDDYFSLAIVNGRIFFNNSLYGSENANNEKRIYFPEMCETEVKHLDIDERIEK